MKGIYTLANDNAYDQLIAFINSVNVNIGTFMPICIIPYNDNMDRIKEAIKIYSNVSIFNNREALEQWDRFCFECWDAHPRNQASRWLRPSWYKTNVARKSVAFDGDFEEFVFFDSDTLVMKPIEDVWEKLQNYDLVFDDWEHSKRTPFTELDIDQIVIDTRKTESQIYPLIHCDSFWGAKQGTFSYKELEDLRQQLVINQKISWVKDKSWWSSSALFSCMTLIRNYRQFNFTQSFLDQDRTGNCADADPFVNIDNVLYNEEGLKPIHRIHYMNYTITQFQKLCNGINEPIRYQDVFLHYRFLLEPEKKPTILRNKSFGDRVNEIIKKNQAKIKRAFL